LKILFSIILFKKILEKVENLTIELIPSKPIYKENENIMLTCCPNPGAYPKPVYSWYKDNTDLSNQQEISGICSSIKVLANRNDNWSHYKCSALNDDRILFKKSQNVSFVVRGKSF